MDEVFDQLEEIDGNVKKWYKDHWKEQWGDSEDRWAAENVSQGWNLDEVRAEFDEFFAKNLGADISTDGQAKDKFELELESAMKLYEKGIESGKVVEAADADESRAGRMQILYDIALLAKADQEKKERDAKVTNLAQK